MSHNGKRMVWQQQREGTYRQERTEEIPENEQLQNGFVTACTRAYLEIDALQFVHKIHFADHV